MIRMNTTGPRLLAISNRQSILPRERRSEEGKGLHHFNGNFGGEKIKNVLLHTTLALRSYTVWTNSKEN